MSETADYVAGIRAAREDDIRPLVRAMTNGTLVKKGERKGDDPYEAMGDLALDVEVYRLVEITFGVGGPADWMEAKVDADGDIRSLTFYASWGSDRYERNITEGPLWAYAEYIVGGLS